MNQNLVQVLTPPTLPKKPSMGCKRQDQFQCMCRTTAANTSQTTKVGGTCQQEIAETLLCVTGFWDVILLNIIDIVLTAKCKQRVMRVTCLAKACRKKRTQNFEPILAKLPSFSVNLVTFTVPGGTWGAMVKTLELSFQQIPTDSVGDQRKAWHLTKSYVWLWLCTVLRIFWSCESCVSFWYFKTPQWILVGHFQCPCNKEARRWSLRRDQRLQIAIQSPVLQNDKLIRMTSRTDLWNKGWRAKACDEGMDSLKIDWIPMPIGIFIDARCRCKTRVSIGPEVKTSETVKWC